MNQKALSTLEYTKIIAQLEEYASTSMGKKRCRELVPMNDLQEIKTAQAQTSDALARILRKGSISFSGAKDIRDSLLRLKVGSSLSIAELLRVSALLRVALRASDYGKRDHEPGEEDDALDAMFRELAPVVSLAKEIDRCILSAPIRKVSTILCCSYLKETNWQLPERNDCAVTGFFGNLALPKKFSEGLK